MSIYKLSDLEEKIEKLHGKDKKIRENTVEELVKIFLQLKEPELQKKVGLALIASLVDDNESVRNAASKALPYYVQDWAAQPLAELYGWDFGWSGLSNTIYYDDIVEALKRIGTPSLPYLAQRVWMGGKFREVLISYGTESIPPLIYALQNPHKDFVHKNHSYTTGAHSGMYSVFLLVEIGTSAIEPLIQALKEIGVQSPAPLLADTSKVKISEKVSISEVLLNGIGAASCRNQIKLRDEIYNKNFIEREQRAVGSMTIPKPLVLTDYLTLASKMNPLMIALIAILKGANTNYYEAIIKAYSLVGEQATKSVISDIDNRNQLIQQAAIDLLGHIGGPLAVQSLISLIEKGDFRQVVLDAIVRVNDPRLVPLIISNLDNKNALITISVIKILGKLSDSRAVEPLALALKDNKDVFIKISFIEILGKLSDSRAVEPLVLALKDNELGVRKAAIKALGQIGDISAIPSLTEQLSDTRGKFLFIGARICDVASEALQQIGTPEALEVVEKWKTKKN